MKKNSRSCSSKRIKRRHGRKSTRKLVSRKSKKLGGVNDPYMTPQGSPIRRRFDDSPQSNLSTPASVYSTATNTPYSPLTPPSPIRVPEIRRPAVPVQRMNLMNRFRQIDQQAADERDEGLTDDESMSGGKRKQEEMTTMNTNPNSKSIRMKKHRRMGDTTWSTSSSSSSGYHLQTPSKKPLESKSKKTIESLNSIMGKATLSDTETSSLTVDSIEADSKMTATNGNTTMNTGGYSRRRMRKHHSKKRNTRRK